MRGKPSRMNDEPGSSQVRGDGKLAKREGVSSISPATNAASSPPVEELELSEYGFSPGKSQPRALSSWRIRRRIMASGTREPDLMADSARMPRGVRFWTWVRRRSPEEMAESWGKAVRRRADWVPLPTPGRGEVSWVFVVWFEREEGEG